jgi:sulfotransferase family protein
MTDKPEVTSEIQELKIIGAGFGRTGTLSLKAALEELGFSPCYHMVEVFNHPQDTAQWEDAARGEPIDWHLLLDGYQATVDWPGCAFYEELLQTYPDARVLLSVRDPASWYESVDSTIYQMRRMTTHFSPAAVFFRVMGLFAPDRRRVGHMINTIVWQGTFNGNFEDKDYAIAIFNRHIENVKKRVPSDKLLVYNIKQGWEPLCTFLGIQVPPDKPFPHLNERTSFMGNRFRQRNSAYLVSTLLVASVLSVLAAALLFLRRQSKRKGLRESRT